MKTEYVQEFLTLTEEMNYQEAADKLSLSQSTLSRHILDLENELGVSLFIRYPRGISLTEEGKHFIPYAKSMNSVYELATDSIKQLDQNLSGTLTIGATSTVLNQYCDIYMDWFCQFLLKYPSIKINIHESSPERLLEHLKNGKCNFVFTPRVTLPDSGEYISMECFRDPLVAVLPKKHPLANEKYISFSQLANECFIMQPEIDPIHQIIQNKLIQLGNNSYSFFNGNLRGAIVSRMVASGYGIAIQPMSQAATENATLVSYVNITPPEYIYLDAIYYNSGINNIGYIFWKSIEASIGKQQTLPYISTRS